MSTTTQPPTTSVDYFEAIYAEAAGDPAQLPWGERRANPVLVDWLNTAAPSLVRCGARVAMVGCGLGADAREVMRRGYEVTGFDCSETAIRWARSLDPENVAGYVQADLFNPPARWVHRFDLVIEVHNVESLTPDRHRSATAALSKLLTPHGRLLVICRTTKDPIASGDGPPWPLTECELLEATAEAGLEPERPILAFGDEGDRRLRAVFKRA